MRPRLGFRDRSMFRLAVMILLAAAVHALFILYLLSPEQEEERRPTVVELQLPSPQPRPESTSEESPSELPVAPHEPEPEPEPEPTDDPAPAAKKKPLDHPEEVAAPSAVSTPERQPAPAPTPPPPLAPPRLNLDALYSDRASIAHELSQQPTPRRQLGERPRHRYLSRTTRDPLYASYFESWIRKVTRVGEMNYPANLSGVLRLDVTLHHTGEILSMSISRSSGNQQLDQATRRIVEMAAPFAPFPDAIRRENDSMTVSKVWRFISNESTIEP